MTLAQRTLHPQRPSSRTPGQIGTGRDRSAESSPAAPDPRRWQAGWLDPARAVGAADVTPSGSRSVAAASPVASGLVATRDKEDDDE